MALFYWAWFTVAPRSKERHALLVTLLSTPVIVLMARLLALGLPFRRRPLHNDALDFEVPDGISEQALGGWSSFPSDHAVLYFAISFGILSASRRIGYVAIIYTFFFIGLPRVYTGYHYPSDILAGLAIAGVLVWSSIRLFANSSVLIRINALSERYPGFFYALMFIISFQIASLFIESRQIALLMFQTVK